MPVEPADAPWSTRSRRGRERRDAGTVEAGQVAYLLVAVEADWPDAYRVSRDGRIAAGEYFLAEQNARLVRNAEEYYRAMFGGRVQSWNLRDTHMMETLEALIVHVRQTTGDAKAVIWAHTRK